MKSLLIKNIGTLASAYSRAPRMLCGRQMNEVLKSEQGSELAELEFDALWKDKSKADKGSCNHFRYARENRSS